MFRPILPWIVLIALGIAPAGASNPDLEKLFDDAWQWELRTEPLAATAYGDPRYNDRLPEVTPGSFDERRAALQGFLKRLEALDRGSLAREEQISYDLFARETRDTLAEYEFRTHLIPITTRSGFHIEFPDLASDAPLITLGDYDNYLARLSGFRLFAEQNIELMRAGLAAGMVLPAEVMHGYETPLKAHLVDDPTQSVLFKPFNNFPAGFSTDDRERLTESGRKAITESVVPGYSAILAFMTDEYVPKCREHVGAWSLPSGRELYRHRVRKFTTLDITPQEVHEIGQSEVRRIDAEMQAVMHKVGFEKSFAEFLEFLRTDSRFYAQTPEQLLKETAFVLKRIDGELPKLFKTLPRMPYGTREVPAYIAPGTTTAYYQPPAGDGSRAGYYYVNTYNLPSRPMFEIEALSLHEAVPGHHLQIALAQEIQGLPPFRRFAGITAFVEGWGLYAERLGLEIGLYQDPYSDFGRLSYEMWRACRLVVDTGMHELGWTRRQAIDFMQQHTALSKHNIEAEVDRYISWPGQAVAYKIGELKIRELRGLAEKELGAKFDRRLFHDVVLGSGAVPLGVLEANVRAWIETVKAKA